MGCYNCKYLKYQQKKDGCINGSVYYCTKIKKYVNGADDGCNAYYKDYSRKNYEADEIYNNGRHYSDDSTPISFYVFLVIVLSIVTFIVNIF